MKEIKNGAFTLKYVFNKAAYIYDIYFNDIHVFAGGDFDYNTMLDVFSEVIKQKMGS